MGSYYFYDLTENLSSSCGLIFVKRVEGAVITAGRPFTIVEAGLDGSLYERVYVPVEEVGFKTSSLGVPDYKLPKLPPALRNVTSGWTLKSKDPCRVRRDSIPDSQRNCIFQFLLYSCE